MPVFINLVHKRGHWLIPIFIWGGFVSWSLFSSIASIQSHGLSIATEGARNMFRMVEMVRLWNAQRAGVYTPVSERVQPNPYLQVPNRDIVTEDGRQLTMLNPAYMTRQIAEVARENGVVFHLTSLKPLRPGNQPDAWEALALKRFEFGEREVSELVDQPEFSVFRYMAPLMVKPACMKCHAKQGYQVGDIRGGISVTLPYESVLQEDGLRIRLAILKHLAVFALVSGLIMYFLARMRRQWLEVENIREQQAQMLKERTAHLQNTINSLREENRLLKEDGFGAPEA
ncbi:MAG: DUF3365 domain-containing protein [Gammaproteobacteria bacterium]|nr:DUF3365 domain-containing protein [Gammaproteobacteria bacterium]